MFRRGSAVPRRLEPAQAKAVVDEAALSYAELETAPPFYACRPGTSFTHVRGHGLHRASPMVR